jgi:hypothetical protein
MKETLETLELERAKLYQQLQALGDFHPDMISVNFRKCGKNNCACHFGRSELVSPPARSRPRRAGPTARPIRSAAPLAPLHAR